MSVAVSNFCNECLHNYSIGLNCHCHSIELVILVPVFQLHPIQLILSRVLWLITTCACFGRVIWVSIVMSSPEIYFQEICKSIFFFQIKKYYTFIKQQCQ